MLVADGYSRDLGNIVRQFLARYASQPLGGYDQSSVDHSGALASRLVIYSFPLVLLTGGWTCLVIIISIIITRTDTLGKRDVDDG